jgi:hypothetical protein
MHQEENKKVCCEDKSKHDHPDDKDVHAINDGRCYSTGSYKLRRCHDGCCKKSERDLP